MIMDFIVRQVSGPEMGCITGLGFLPIVVVDGKEVYRGEYKRSFDEAMSFAEEAGYNFSMTGYKNSK